MGQAGRQGGRGAGREVERRNSGVSISVYNSPGFRGQSTWE